jgi:penicillin-binding protein 1A
MREAIKKYGGTRFRRAAGRLFPQDRPFHRRALSDDASGECGGRIFPRRRGAASASAAMVDGGFAMGSNLPLFAYGETDGRSAAT